MDGINWRSKPIAHLEAMVTNQCDSIARLENGKSGKSFDEPHHIGQAFVDLLVEHGPTLLSYLARDRNGLIPLSAIR